MNSKVLISLLALGLSTGALAHGVAYSTFPLSNSQDQKLLSTELTGDMSEGGGMGMQGRFVYAPKMIKGVFDAGIGVAGGDRDVRFFGGYDYEIFPDYKSQPKLSVKSMFEWVNENSEGIKKFSAAPTLTKGFSFWGREGYPYVSLPVGISLNGDKSTYENFAELGVGITGQLPIRGYSHLMANLEANVGMMNSSSGIRIGISYPIN